VSDCFSDSSKVVVDAELLSSWCLLVTRASSLVLKLTFVFVLDTSSVVHFFVSTSAADCLERFVSQLIIIIIIIIIISPHRPCYVHRCGLFLPAK